MFTMTAAESKKLAPVAGMAATYCIGSDYYPVTITRVSKTGAVVYYRHDKVLGGQLFGATEGHSEADERANRTQDGTYRTGRAGYLHLGERINRMDPGF